MDAKTFISGALAITIVIAVGGSQWNRIQQRKGIGWQFIRFNAIAVVLLLTGILALNDALSSAVTAILAGALGYAFGKGSREDADA